MRSSHPVTRLSHDKILPYSFNSDNICVFDHTRRHSGIGTVLMNTILQEAKESGARMVVLETQTCNENAIAFYRKNGFDIIGFDLFAYTNIDPERHEIRIEMGKQLWKCNHVLDPTAWWAKITLEKEQPPAKWLASDID